MKKISYEYYNRASHSGQAGLLNFLIGTRRVLLIEIHNAPLISIFDTIVDNYKWNVDRTRIFHVDFESCPHYVPKPIGLINLIELNK